MPVESIQETMKFEIQAYRKPRNIRDLRSMNVAFSGSPRKHPHDHQRVILVVDPVSTNTFFYEFQIDDITYVENQTNIVNFENETIPMVRVWIKKGSLGIRSTPFVVEDTI
ncbi:MAG: inorganic pyrophosphatase Ppa [Desulfobacteraceae bacterium]|nr:inorganic pyrophosphatase Ppa [Desulfobacteraceae bacterium]